MFAEFGTVSFTGVFGSVKSGGSGVATALGLLLLLGACGKSAQVPLQSWLLDAMEGPTPVSALIHAATMVTAGVYLLVRSNPILAVSPDARLAVALVGTVTLLFGGIIACAKDDIKKSLAGSTMSQIGYMTLGAGLGPEGYVFAIALLLVHGFFKAGLFLGAGSVMHGMNDEVNMRKFGGLARVMPVTYVTFGLAYLAIIGIPPFSGFFAKDPIIEGDFTEHGAGGKVLGILALIGAGITAFYMTRMMFMTWYGKRRWEAEAHPHESPSVMTWPMIVLAIGSVGAGAFLIINDRLQDFLAPVVGVPPASHGFVTVTGVVALVLVLAGVALAWADVRAGAGPGGRPARAAAHRRRPQGPVRRRVQRVGPDAARPVADQALGVLRQPGRGRPGQHARRHGRRDVRPDAQAADRLRPLVRPVHVLRRRCPGRLAAGGEALMNGFPWLTVAGAVPLLGAIVIALIPGLPADSAEADRQARNAVAKMLALGFSLLTLVVVIIIAVKFQVGGPNYQFTESYSWIPAFGVHYALGVDGIALVLIAMSAVLMPVVILASWWDADGVLGARPGRRRDAPPRTPPRWPAAPPRPARGTASRRTSR